MGKKFEAQMQAAQFGSDKDWLDAIARTADTVGLFTLWVEEHAPSYRTPFDIAVGMAKLALEQYNEAKFFHRSREDESGLN